VDEFQPKSEVVMAEKLFHKIQKVDSSGTPGYGNLLDQGKPPCSKLAEIGYMFDSEFYDEVRLATEKYDIQENLMDQESLFSSGDLYGVKESKDSEKK
jgi:hypothetical protein